MKKATKKVFKVIVSIIYIFWGIMAPVSAFNAIIALDVSAMISAGVGILMLLAGIFGLLGMKKMKCRLFGIIIFVFSLVSLVTFILGGGAFTDIMALVRVAVPALLSWFYIVSV